MDCRTGLGVDCVDLFVMVDECVFVLEREIKMKMTAVMIFGGSFEEVVEHREISSFNLRI